MALSVFKTWIAELLTAADLNSSFNRILTYNRENKDRVVGDDAEGTGVTAHTHDGTYGATLAADSVTEATIDGLTATIAEINTVADGITATADQLNRIVKFPRIRNCELLYQTSDLLTVQFPCTEPGGTAWSNVTGIDVSQNVTSSGNVKDGVTINEASKWYYLYLSNSFTIAQPVTSEFLFTQSHSGESGYTLVGAIYNDSTQAIQEFYQQGKLVRWHDSGDEGIKVLDGGTSTSFVDVDCSAAMPATSSIASIVGTLYGTSTDADHCLVRAYVRRNGGSTNGVGCLRVDIHNAVAEQSAAYNAFEIETDSAQIFEYKLNTNGEDSSTALHFRVMGYHTGI